MQTSKFRLFFTFFRLFRPFSSGSLGAYRSISGGQAKKGGGDRSYQTRTSIAGLGRARPLLSKSGTSRTSTLPFSLILPPYLRGKPSIPSPSPSHTHMRTNKPRQNQRSVKEGERAVEKIACTRLAWTLVYVLGGFETPLSVLARRSRSGFCVRRGAAEQRHRVSGSRSLWRR